MSQGQHVVTALVQNEAGTINRLVSLFRRRGFSLASFNAGDCEEPGFSRLTLLVNGDNEQVSQCLKQLDKLVDVQRNDEIGDLARDFNEMVVQLKELENMKREFVAGVTHDFGTPLHAIKNAIELMQEAKAGPLTPKQTEYLLMMSNSTIQLTSFINNLLTSAKIEAAKSEPYFEELDVPAITKEVVDLYLPQAEKQGLSLTVVEESTNLSLMSDLTMFRQILNNLISNALKYTLKGSVTVKLGGDFAYFILKVSDTGVGIDPKNKDLIFDKFFRVRQPKEFPARQGSGLGLSIVKGLAESLGGSISVDSMYGMGSTFIVKLPRRHDKAAGLEG